MHQRYQLVQILEQWHGHWKFSVLNQLTYFLYQPIMKTRRQLFSVRYDFPLLRHSLSVNIMVPGFQDILKKNDLNLFLANALTLYLPHTNTIKPLVFGRFEVKKKWRHWSETMVILISVPYLICLFFLTHFKCFHSIGTSQLTGFYVGDNSLSTFAKFSEKLAFLTS